jgi:hypothetical protein
MQDMDTFVDLQGASGVTYRFKAWSEAGQTPMAGNFAVIEGRGTTLKVLMAGVVTDLSTAPRHADVSGLGGGSIFVRLNVARATRHREHDDIVANYRPAKLFDAEA